MAKRRTKTKAVEEEVPAAIKAALPTGARAFAIAGMVSVILADGREVWLSRDGAQTGRRPAGTSVRFYEDVPWKIADATTTRAA